MAGTCNDRQFDQEFTETCLVLWSDRLLVHIILKFTN